MQRRCWIWRASRLAASRPEVRSSSTTNVPSHAPDFDYARLYDVWDTRWGLYNVLTLALDQRGRWRQRARRSAIWTTSRRIWTCWVRTGGSGTDFITCAPTFARCRAAGRCDRRAAEGRAARITSHLVAAVRPLRLRTCAAIRDSTPRCNCSPRRMSRCERRSSPPKRRRNFTPTPRHAETRRAPLPASVHADRYPWRSKQSEKIAPASFIKG